MKLLYQVLRDHKLLSNLNAPPHCAPAKTQSLVMIDFLVRHGHLDPHDPHYLEIVHGLRWLR